MSLKNNWLEMIAPMIAILLGLVVFSFYFDFSIVDPANTAWMLREYGDSMQHYLGSYAFRMDSWHFPITKTTYINYPEGVSIIYTDSNPLLSIIAKLFKGIFPPEFQVFGFWYLLCWTLQSLFGYMIVKHMTNNTAYALLSGFLFCLFPTQIFRINHANLVGFWLILWAIYVFIHKDYSDNRKGILFFAIFLISAMVHAYITVMALTIAAVWFIDKGIELIRAKNFRGLKAFFARNLAMLSMLIACLWVLGYFYNTADNSGLLGFGYFSMNLIAIFNPLNKEFSNFLPSIHIEPGQYEGYQYAGLGMLILFFLTAILILKNVDFKKLKPINYIIWIVIAAFIMLIGSRETGTYVRILALSFVFIYALYLTNTYRNLSEPFFKLFIAATVCLLLALSHEAYLGNFKLYSIPVSENAFYSGFLRGIRSSGRFFWVTAHIMVLFGLYKLYKATNLKTSISILSLLIVVQFADMSKLSYRIDSNNKAHSTQVNEDLQKMILASSSVRFVGKPDMRIAEFALLNKIPINNFYIAHSEGRLTVKKLQEEKQELSHAIKDSNTYIFKLKDLPDGFDGEVVNVLAEFYAFPPKNFENTLKTVSIGGKEQE